MMVSCVRCGNCCGYWSDKDHTQWVSCKFLVRLSSGKTLCRIYRNRLMTCIGTGADGNLYYCGEREKVPVNFPDCPYNRPEWKDYTELGTK